MPTTRTDDTARLYNAIFRATPPALVRERFCEAAALLQANASPHEVAEYRRAMDLGVDLEALEVAARYRRKCRLLSDHFRLMVYVAETLPENQSFFVKRTPSRAGAVAALAGGGVRTVYKLAKGIVLLRRLSHG